jgi:hypothetical protein
MVNAPKSVVINGVNLDFPEYKPGDDCLFIDLPKKDQIWIKPEIPEHFSEDWFALPNEEELAFAIKEIDRIKNGVWISINGETMWITGLNYFYLTYWILDTGESPNFRMSDVRFWWWWEACSRDDRCLGTIFTKFRRQGASSRGACIAVYYGILLSNINCGVVSKTGGDASAIFSDMIINGFKSLEDFLKPQSAGTDKVTKKLHISKQSERMTKSKRIVSKVQGLNNVIDWMNTAMNSYDGKRLRYLFLDESGKFPPDVPFNKYWDIVKRCLVEGAKRRGMAYVPSTVNEMNKGGTSFKKVWDMSNHLAKDYDGATASGLWKYFQPAYDGYEGYIGRYGESIVDTPTAEQTEYLKEIGCPNPYVGAKEYQLNERRKLASDAEALSEYIRQHPHEEREAFFKKSDDSHFNPMHINLMLQRIEEANIQPRRVSPQRDPNTGKVRLIDDIQGRWWVLWDFPVPEQSNNCQLVRGMLTPKNAHEFAMGCDPYSHTVISGKGSNGAAVLFRKYNPLDPNNSDMPIAVYLGRPSKGTMFLEWALMAEYYGCKIGVEEINDEYYTWFTDEGLDNFLIWTPLALQNKANKLTKRRPGIPGGSVKAMEYHTNIMVEYMRLNWEKMWFAVLLLDMIDFDVNERTDFDLTMAFGYALITAKEMDVRPVRIEEESSIEVLKTYSIKR